MTDEMRYLGGDAGGKCELRMVEGKEGGGGGMIVGYAAVYNSLSQDLGGFREMVMPGAFKRALADGPDVRARYNHEQLLGRSKSGTLRMIDDAKGLRYEIDVPDTSVGRDLAESIRRGDVDGSSFCFRVTGSDGETWRKNTDGGPVRELRALELLDVGPVDCPAYLGTEGKVNLRSLPEASQVLAKSLGGVGEVHVRAAKLKLAEAGCQSRQLTRLVKAENRFWVESGDADAALSDACAQVWNALDSVISVSYKLPENTSLYQICFDTMLLTSCLSQVATNPDSTILGGVKAMAETALTACAAACAAVDHPVCRLASAVCQVAAEQCHV